MDYKAIYFPENEKPLDRLVSDGGFASIFRTIACVGDSLSSGEFETQDENGVNHYYDMFEYSWGQYIARAAGCKVYNFSRGGMTAKEYCENFADHMGYWDRALAAQAYIVALGVNDIANRGQAAGDISDIDFADWHNNNMETFMGCYGQVIQRLKEVQPDAKFFLVTMPRSGNPARDEKAQIQRDCVMRIAESFENCYVLDLYTYAPVYDDEFREHFHLRGHMNPCGYIFTAQMFISYIDYIVRHNMDDFRQVGFIGKQHLESFNQAEYLRNRH